MVSLVNNIFNKPLVFTKGLIIFIIILLIQVTLIGCTNTSTVCFGSQGPPCITHRLSCTSPLVIQIINTTYGYRPGCNDIAIVDCNNITCCNEELGDCFIPFTSDENRQVLRSCSRKEKCTVSGFRETSGRLCGGTTSAYSKIQYDCVTKVKTSPASTGTTSIQPTSQPSTTIQLNSTTFPIFSTATEPDVGAISNVGSIVGGIFGVIIIIVIIIVVVVFLYKRRKKSPSKTPPSTDKKTFIQTVTPHYRVIDGPGTINSSKDISGYDEIELDNKPKVQATATHLNSSITHNRKTQIQTTDNYDHVGDDKLKVKSAKDLDDYNHIGTHDHSVHEDNYNHIIIGNNPSVSSNHLESDYNHINGVFGTFNDEDDYNHIGYNDNNNLITDDNYHHIGSGDIKVEGNYDHIGSESNDNHIHGDNNQVYNDNDSPYNLATC